LNTDVSITGLTFTETKFWPRAEDNRPNIHQAMNNFFIIYIGIENP